jgi:protein-S-isoprenylcysteine O-methyltransferase Ste14
MVGMRRDRFAKNRLSYRCRPIDRTERSIERFIHGTCAKLAVQGFQTAVLIPVFLTTALIFEPVTCGGPGGTTIRGPILPGENTMVTGPVPNRVQTKSSHFPHWLTPIILAVLFLLVHVAAPWALSLLSTRYGWTDGRPGPGNLLALIPVGVGVAATVWLIVLHYRASPRSFLEFKRGEKLLTPGPYAFSRNPMYLFELVFWFGWALFYGSLAVLIGFLLFLAILNFVILPYEERDLEARFGDAYLEYKQSVPRWLGQIRR